MSGETIGPAWIDFPLGVNQDPVSEAPTARPFGLRYTTEPREVVDVVWSDLSYDATRQMAVISDQTGNVIPAMKHTNTKTKATTNTQDRNPSDEDEDWTGS